MKGMRCAAITWFSILKLVSSQFLGCCSFVKTLKFMVPHHVAKTASLKEAVFAITLKEVEISFLALSVAGLRSDRIDLQGGTSMHLKLGQGQAEFLLLHPGLDLFVECRAYG